MMDEKQLFAAWHKHDAQIEQDVNEQLEQKIKMMDKKSNDIFEKLYKNTKTELILSGVFLLVIPAVFYSNSTEFWLLMVFLLITSMISIRLCVNYLMGLKKINEGDLIKSLTMKIDVLRDYVKRQKLYVYIFTPVAFAFGFFRSLEGNEFDLLQILLFALFSAPFLYIIIRALNQYIEKRYGNSIQDLETLLHDFKETA